MSHGDQHRPLVSVCRKGACHERVALISNQAKENRPWTAGIRTTDHRITRQITNDQMS